MEACRYSVNEDIFSVFARAAGLEPATNGFGDHYSTN
jgi:hypothetical protein